MSTKQHPDPVTLDAFPRHTARAKARMVSAFSVVQARQNHDFVRALLPEISAVLVH